MKRRTLIALGAVFALLLAWAWIQRPNPVGREFYKAGIRPVFVETVHEIGTIEYQYDVPNATEQQLIDIFDRAGYHSDLSGPLATGGLNLFYKHPIAFYPRLSQSIALYPGKVNMIRTSFKLN